MSEGELAVILHRLDEQDKVLEEIKTHAQKTNGRVTQLELSRAWMKGALAVITFVVPILAGLAAALVK